MRTIAATVFILALGVSFSIVTATGLAGVLGADRAPDGSEAQEQLQRANDSVPIDNPDSFVGGVSQTGDANLIGLIISGFGLISDVVVGVVKLPVTLMNLGLPSYAAIPIGLFTQAITGIGLIEFASNRELT
jgi:hypothetical protein